jgi:hypothetical protein
MTHELRFERLIDATPEAVVRLVHGTGRPSGLWSELDGPHAADPQIAFGAHDPAAFVGLAFVQSLPFVRAAVRHPRAVLRIACPVFVAELGRGKSPVDHRHQGLAALLLEHELELGCRSSTRPVGLPNAFTQLARVVSAGLQKPKAKCCVSGARRCRSGR